MKSVLVGIPFHNASDFAIKAAKSALRQTVDTEVVFCNDNSDPEHLEAVISFAQENGCEIIQVQERLNRDNPNLGTAVNYLLDQVRLDHDYYLNLESDVEFTECVDLALLIDCLQDTPQACAAFPMLVNAERQNVFCAGEGMESQHPRLDALPEHLRRRRFTQWAHLSCLLIRSSDAFNQTNRIDEAFRLWYADFDFAWRLAHTTGGRPMYEPSAWAIHYGSRSSLGKNWPGIETFEEARKRVHEKWQKPY